MKKIHNSVPVILITIILVFSILRLYKLGQYPVSLFSDEVDIGYQVKSFLATGKDYQGNYLPLQFHSFSDVRTALPIYSTTLVSLIPGVSVDQAIRLTPAIYSLVGLLGIFLLTNSLFRIFKLSSPKDIIPGLIAASLLSMTPWHFTYSRTGFELSQLFASVTLGIHFLIKYLEKNQIINLLVSLFFLSLAPAIYSTAKLSILFFPLVFLSLPGFVKQTKSKTPLKIFMVVLFVPLALLFLNGGAGKRFSEIAVYTDPTLSTQTNFLRQADLGKNLIIGSSPSFLSKTAHNKPLMIATSFVKNIFGPISTNFLFTSGDKNLRHAVPGWGMLLKGFALLIIVGGYLLIFRNRHQLVFFLGAIALLSIIPAALTRDGATHSSRTFLLVIPLIIVASYGLYSLIGNKILKLILGFVILFESFLYFHDYFFHYPVLSERDFHAGMKELVSEANKYPGKTVVLTRTYEPSLIFFLYYTDFSPAKSQELIPQGNLTEGIKEDLNLEGVKVTGTNIYLASVRDFGRKDPLVVKDAVYVIPAINAAGLVTGNYATKISDIYLPSGLLMFSTITPATPSAATSQSI